MDEIHLKAIVKYAHGKGKVELRDVPKPSPGPDEVLIEVKAAGICGSDLHILDGDIELPVRPPVIMGHEFSGIIAEVGSSVTKWKPGDRVTSETSIHTCGECLPCKTGNYNVCAEKRLIGYWFDGAFAKYCVAPSKLIHKLPDNVSFLAGALCEPLACCVNGVVEKTRIDSGDVVVIAGPGPIGLLSTQIAKSQGAYVILCGLPHDEKRLKLGKTLGADMIINVEEEDPWRIVSEITGGSGADVFIECSGSPNAARMGLQMVRRMGQYTQIGLFGRTFSIDFDLVAYKELKVRGSLGQRWTSWNIAVKMLSRGLVKAEPLISDVLPLHEWKIGFEKFRRKEAIKVILKPE